MSRAGTTRGVGRRASDQAQDETHQGSKGSRQQSTDGAHVPFIGIPQPDLHPPELSWTAPARRAAGLRRSRFAGRRRTELESHPRGFSRARPPAADGALPGERERTLDSSVCINVSIR
jgi:hypothetical protein